MYKIPFVIILATHSIVNSLALADDKAIPPPVIESTHGVNFSQVRNMAYRIDWVNQQTALGLRLPTLTDEDMFAIDLHDQLVCYNLDNGQWRWSSPVGNHIYELLGINPNETAEQVFVITDGAVFAFESSTGNLPTQAGTVQKDSTDKSFQKLSWAANTPAVAAGPNLLYGSRNGELVWHDCSIGFTSKTYSIATAMSSMPAISDGIVVASGDDGAVAAIDIKTARARWLIKLLDAVVATPTISNSTVYIAGTDQYLRAIDLYTGRPRWKHLTTAELIDSPFVIGDALYQRIPTIGLACFSAFAPDITGELRWTSQKVNGIVVTTTPNNRLLCWDKENRIIQEVDPRLGTITSTMELPLVTELLVDSPNLGNIYLITDDNAILKLTPRRATDG
ncbi:PQQ-binding-like beta-propeller repeat protein [PVC group bacterium]|nr:PQQ-binding-like beta-propeller repeat protein [PVC group bacterium]